MHMGIGWWKKGELLRGCIINNNTFIPGYTQGLCNAMQLILKTKQKIDGIKKKNREFFLLFWRFSAHSFLLYRGV